MWKTVLSLIIGIIVIPVVGFYLDEPPTALQREALVQLAWIYVVSAGLCFVVSTLSRNYSQVDKLWSIMPIIYAWVAAYWSGFEPRIVLMAVVASIWGLRLTLNFARRGGYKLRFWEGEEDYRWAVLRAKPEFQGKWKWLLFNLFFISYYQMGLILLFTLPIVRSIGGGPLGLWDYLLALLALGLVVVEAIADNQQHKYQTEKYRRINKGELLAGDYAKGFLDKGLWAHVRHPNYAAEQSVWIVFYLFSVVASGLFFNWSVVGCILLVILFWSSSKFSEEISAGKYPQYADYQRRVPRFFPFIK